MRYAKVNGVDVSNQHSGDIPGWKDIWSCGYREGREREVFFFSIHLFRLDVAVGDACSHTLLRIILSPISSIFGVDGSPTEYRPWDRSSRFLGEKITLLNISLNVINHLGFRTTLMWLKCIETQRNACTFPSNADVKKKNNTQQMMDDIIPKYRATVAFETICTRYFNEFVGRQVNGYESNMQHNSLYYAILH